MILFTDTSANPSRFFDLLPPDWQEGIVPYWPDYQATARIFILKKNGEMLGGGIVFSTVSPDTMAYREVAQRWFDQGYLYIAFLFFPEKYRGQGLGSVWLRELEKFLPSQPFWLTVEGEGLRNFYKKNGYRLAQKVQGEHGPELVLVKEGDLADR